MDIFEKNQKLKNAQVAKINEDMKISMKEETVWTEIIEQQTTAIYYMHRHAIQIFMQL